MTIQEILKEYWGYDTFRPLQQEIMEAVLEGKDILALMPTGGGKSLCFQVPAMAKDGICLVISPLIALMKDQVQNLKNKGIPALSIYSGMSFLEVKKTLQNAIHGNYKFLYVSPERLETNLFLDYLPDMKISLIAVDEAHCISQWGYDFRPSYLRIAELREYLPNTPILALTASATAAVQDDICMQLKFSNTHCRFQQSFERANLSYSIFNAQSKQNKLLEILNNVKGSAIVYCKSRRHTKDVADLLLMNKINASFYHAGLSNEDRSKRQQDWINNTTRVMACTNAFGMGIDKPDVRVVVHFDVPDCLENYYQEAGRAGRDGKRAYAVLLYNTKEVKELQLQTNIKYPDKAEIKKVYTAVMNYLQIAAGGGEGVSLEFDLASFAAAFKINILMATYAIKTLEQEEILRFNDVFFKPSSLVFTCERDQLNAFEEQYPEMTEVVKGLLRSYEGIFDYPATINEAELAKFIQKKIPDVLEQLNKMHRLGILNYSARKDKPQVTLLQNRMYADSFVINLTNYLERKKNFDKRIKTIARYIEQSIMCRSRMVALYFNDNTVKNCGICDNCINQNDLVVSSEEFEMITEKILKEITAQAQTPADIIKLTGIKKEKFWKVINYLQAEKKVNVTKEGLLEKM